MSDQSKQDELLEVRYGTPSLNEWKQYFRNMKQAPAVQREATPESSEESSFELDESFRALLNRKREQMREKADEDQMLSDDEAATPREHGEESSSYPKLVSGNDSTFVDHASISKVSNTSFEEMERMCAVLGEVSNLSVNDVSPAEQQEVKPMPATLTTYGDVTQLDDVDEPSGLWENTILPGSSSQMLSPMKRVHQLRPSTIIEESTINEAGSSKNSSIDTYISAQQRESREGPSRSSAVSGSEVYRTAEDTFATDSYARSSAMDSGLVYDNTTSDNRTDYEHREQYGDESAYSKNSTAEAGLTDVQNVIILDSSSSDCENEDHGFQQQPQGPLDPQDPLDSITSRQDETFDIGNEQSSVPDGLEESSEHNMSELEEMPDHFNDTMEETDYMLRQGMKLMAMKKKEELQLSQSVEQQQHQKSRTNSESDDGATFVRHIAKTPAGKGELKPTDTSNFSYLTPSSAMKSKLNVSYATGSSGCKQTLFSSAGKNNVTKKYLDPASFGGSASGGTFKRPVISRLPQLKVGQRKFDHIVSPIGAYIKTTPQSILQKKINCPNKNLIDVLHSENRDSVLSSRGSKENYHGMVAGAGKGYTPSLPGKGVISSNRAHVLDERNLMRIPGGEKMQKLINGSPTMVIRHEGRIRYAGESGGAGRKLMMNDSTIGDDSLKDISIASNDVSVRVLHDAKRF